MILPARTLSMPIFSRRFVNALVLALASCRIHLIFSG